MFSVSNIEFAGYVAISILVVTWCAMIMLGRSGHQPRAKDLADDSQVDYTQVYGGAEAPLHEQTHTLRVDTSRASARFDPLKCILVEVDNDVQLSRFANALATGGFAISNTPRATLRIHPMKNWQPDEPADLQLAENVIGFPMPGRQAS